MHKHLVINDKVEVLTRFCLLGIRIKKDSLINFRQPLFYAYCYFKNFSEYAILRGLKKLIRQPLLYKKLIIAIETFDYLTVVFSLSCSANLVRFIVGIIIGLESPDNVERVAR